MVLVLNFPEIFVQLAFSNLRCEHFLKVRVPRSDYKVQSQITDLQFLVEWLLRELKMDPFWTTVFILFEEKSVFSFFLIFLEVFSNIF